MSDPYSLHSKNKKRIINFHTSWHTPLEQWQQKQMLLQVVAENPYWIWRKEQQFRVSLKVHLAQYLLLTMATDKALEKTYEKWGITEWYFSSPVLLLSNSWFTDLMYFHHMFRSPCCTYFLSNCFIFKLVVFLSSTASQMCEFHYLYVCQWHIPCVFFKLPPDNVLGFLSLLVLWYTRKLNILSKLFMKTLN